MVSWRIALFWGWEIKIIQNGGYAYIKIQRLSKHCNSWRFVYCLRAYSSVQDFSHNDLLFDQTANYFSKNYMIPSVCNHHEIQSWLSWNMHSIFFAIPVCICINFINTKYINFVYNMHQRDSSILNNNISKPWGIHIVLAKLQLQPCVNSSNVSLAEATQRLANRNDSQLLRWTKKLLFDTELIWVSISSTLPSNKLTLPRKILNFPYQKTIKIVNELPWLNAGWSRSVVQQPSPWHSS